MPKKTDKKLTIQQQSFCDYKLRNPFWSDAKCYMKEYPTVMKEETAAALASRLIRNEKVIRY